MHLKPNPTGGQKMFDIHVTEYKSDVRILSHELVSVIIYIYVNLRAFYRAI